MTEQTLTCARCSTPIADNDCYWEEDGQICQACMQLQETEQRFLKQFKGTSFGALGASMLGWLFNPFFIVSIGAISTAIWAIRYYKTKNPLEQKVIARNRGFLAPAIIGLCLAATQLLLGVARLALGITGLAFL
jgi:hypothetical protein